MLCVVWAAGGGVSRLLTALLVGEAAGRLPTAPPPPPRPLPLIKATEATSDIMSFMGNKTSCNVPGAAGRLPAAPPVRGAAGRMLTALPSLALGLNSPIRHDKRFRKEAKRGGTS